jgi:hypothetical protein
MWIAMKKRALAAAVAALYGNLAFAGASQARGVDASAELSIGSIYGRFASLKELGYKELACKLEATIRKSELKPRLAGAASPSAGVAVAVSGAGAASGASSGAAAAPGANPSPGAGSSASSSAVSGAAGAFGAEAMNEALKGVSFSLSMRPGECSVAESLPAVDPGPKAARLARAVAEALQVPCAKLSLHYFRHPLGDYGKEQRLSAQAGWYRIGFGSGDYKLTAFLGQDLRVMREYSDGKENQTDIIFRQEGDKLAPASLVVKAQGKVARIDGLSYELKKGQPVLSGFRAAFDDGERSQEISAKLSACRLIN